MKLFVPLFGFTQKRRKVLRSPQPKPEPKDLSELERVQQLECSCAIAFIRLGVEWQHWAGNSDVETGSVGRSFADPGPEINAFANAGDQTLNLIGLAASAGFTY